MVSFEWYVHVYMEISQGNSLYSYLKQTKFPFPYKNGEHEVRICLVWMFVTNARGEDVGIGYRRMNMVEILCTHICKWEMRSIETTAEMGAGRIKENDGRDEFNYNVL
jgi:hypothetical protein